MILSFADQGTENVFNGKNSAPARRTCPRALWAVAYRKLDQLDSSTALNDMAVPPGNRLEPLRSDRVGKHSVRINEQFRICFCWTAAGPDEVEIVDYHA